MSSTVASSRVASIDAYRGFTMLAMISASFGMSKFLQDPNLGWLADQFTHRDWVGCTVWDLIQPSFMFLVGVSMPIAFGLRQDAGESWQRQFSHAWKRALILIYLGVVLDSMNKPEPIIQFIRVLQQIAIGYIIAFFTLNWSFRKQLYCALALLGIHTFLHVVYALVASPPDKSAMDIMWVKNLNFGYVLDQRIHKFFEGIGCPSIFPPSTGGYATTNAISSAATIILGCMVGRMFRERWAVEKQVRTLFLLGLSCLVVGYGLSYPLPMVKKIWTASFGIFAAGWTCLTFGIFHWLMEEKGFRAWAFAFQVAGMNSIFLYISAGTLSGTFRSLLMPYTQHAFGMMGNWGPVALALTLVACHWLLAYWLYRRKIFFKV